METLLTITSSNTFLMVLIGTSLLGILCGTLGAFVVLRQEALLGDGLAHSALPGIVLAFWIVGTKSLPILIMGALFGALLATYCLITALRKINLPFDGMLAATLATFFALGVTLLSVVQKQGNANQAGLKQFIFGQASTILEQDIYFIIIIAIPLLLTLALLWKEFSFLAFDAAYGMTLGFSMKVLQALLYCMIAVSVLLSLQAIGIILTSALLIAPFLAARQWCCTLGESVVLSAFIGGLSAFCGTYVSSAWAWGGVPTGPSIAIFACTFALVSILFVPKRGVVYKQYILWRERGQA